MEFSPEAQKELNELLLSLQTWREKNRRKEKMLYLLQNLPLDPDSLQAPEWAYVWWEATQEVKDES